MRAPHHFLGHRHRVHLIVSKKQCNFLERLIVPDVPAVGKPPAQRDRLGVRRNDHRNGRLAGTLGVRSIESDGAGRIAAKALFALFV
jgi:hypothetical protein